MPWYRKADGTPDCAVLLFVTALAIGAVLMVVALVFGL
jgi:hypothetical protein